MTRLILTVVAMAAATILTRAAPFLFFSRRRPPPVLTFLQAYLPLVLMTVLVLSAFRTVDWTEAPHGLPAIAGVAITAALHFWRRNTLLSIGCGTALYMALSRLL